ncbi:MAG: TonB family protein [Opitutales bacterium]
MSKSGGLTVKVASGWPRKIPLRSLLASLLATIITFLLLPLSQLANENLWEVREIDWIELPKPPPPKSVIEREIEQEKREASKPPEITRERPKLTLQALEASLEVGPGEFRSAFTLDTFTSASALGGELVFELHQLDKRPVAINPRSPHYPPHLKRRGLEGEVRLLVQIDEKGVLKVESILSYPHPDFRQPSVEAAEATSWTVPTYNGKPVKTQFVLPVRFKIVEG